MSPFRNYSTYTSNKSQPLSWGRLLLSIGLAICAVTFFYQTDWVNTIPVEEQRGGCNPINNPGPWKQPLQAFNRQKNDPENPTWDRLGKAAFQAKNIVLASYQGQRGRRIDIYLKDGSRTFKDPIRLRSEFERLTQVEQHLPGSINSCCFVKIRRKTSRRPRAAGAQSLSGSNYLLNIGEIEKVETLDAEYTYIKMKGFRAELPVGTRKVKEQIIPKIKEYWTCKGQPRKPDTIIQ